MIFPHVITKTVIYCHHLHLFHKTHTLHLYFSNTYYHGVLEHFKHAPLLPLITKLFLLPSLELEWVYIQTLLGFYMFTFLAFICLPSLTCYLHPPPLAQTNTSEKLPPQLFKACGEVLHYVQELGICGSTS